MKYLALCGLLSIIFVVGGAPAVLVPERVWEFLGLPEGDDEEE
jgi:hypothetical protein